MQFCNANTHLPYHEYDVEFQRYSTVKNGKMNSWERYLNLIFSCLFLSEWASSSNIVVFYCCYCCVCQFYFFRRVFLYGSTARKVTLYRPYSNIFEGLSMLHLLRKIKKKKKTEKEKNARSRSTEICSVSRIAVPYNSLFEFGCRRQRGRAQRITKRDDCDAKLTVLPYIPPPSREFRISTLKIELADILYRFR